MHKEEVSTLVIFTRIREAAKANGVKISYLCDKIGVCRTYFANTEAQGRDIPDERLEDIARVIGTTVEYLRGISDDPTPEEKRKSTDHELKVALFGGDAEVSDAMWEEVKQYAQYVRQKYNK